jgi:hypothetical protein
MSLAEIALGAGRASASGGRSVVDIITFIEAPWGLGMRLFPVQKVILKTYYGLPLDDTTPITITDWRRTKETKITEADYLKMMFDEGRCNIREIEPGRERREMVLSIGRRAGKCVVGDTLVLTDTGIRRMDDLGDVNGPEFQPLNVGVAQEKQQHSRSAYFYNGGVQPTFRIRTYAGAVLEGTGKHRIKIMRKDGTIDWCRLDEIEIGAQTCTHRGADLWATEPVDLRPYHVAPKRKSAVVQPDTFNEDWGLLLGYLVGDGCWTNRTSLAVTVEHPETLDELRQLFGRTVGKSSFSPDLRTDRTGSIRAHDRALREFLHNLGYRYDVGVDTKATPWVILRSPRHIVRAYLQALFETDGSTSSDGRSVSFSSASRRLAEETRALLLNFGVTSRIRTKHINKYKRDYYELTLTGRRSKVVFDREVGFRSEKKNTPLRANINRTRREGGDSESIPYQKEWVARLLNSIPKALPGDGWSRSVLRTALGPVCKSREKVELTYDRLRSILPLAKDLGADSATLAHFEDIDALDYAFDEVVSIEHGEAPVFDLNVPEGASFVANGMMNHNTTMSACIAAYETYRLINKGDPQGYYGLPASNNIQLISVATDKDQAGLLYQEVSGHFRNCLAGETQVITANGTKAIRDLSGSSHVLLTRDGSWVEAPIRNFGSQKLYRIVVQRQGVQREIYATADHRWFARDARHAYRGKGFQEFTTAQLRPGKHHLQSTFGRSYKNRVDPSPFGVAHGFTFGDGTTVKGQRNANHVYLLGEKDSALLPYFSMCPQIQRPVSVGMVDVSAIPNFFRDFPPLSENKSYLLGWLMGYFAADGSASGGQIKLASAVKRNIEFVRDVCVLLGIGTYDIREETRTSNLTNRPFTMYSVHLMRDTLDESFFVLPSHKEAFVEAGGSDVRRKVVQWTVMSVEETDRVEDVYCATVEGHGDFVLDGNIATGNCGFFAPYTANNTQSYARFQSPKDIERYGSYHTDPTAKATLKVTFRSCVAKGLRGAGNIVIILDEVAHFTDDGQSSADAVYNAVVPSSAAFSKKDPTNPTIPVGSVESKVISISSPLGRQGLFYRLFSTGYQSAKIAEERLCIQAPTWEVNPTVPAGFFEAEYVKDARVFFTEYGAEFSDRTRGWIEEANDLLACVEPTARPRFRAPPRQPHFAGIDVALVGDYTTIAIGHTDDQNRIIVDLVQGIRAGEGDYEDCDRLEFTDVAEWIHQWSKQFYITEGLFDQWLGIPLEQALVAKGLNQFKSFKSTPQLNSQMYQNFKDMMFDRRLVLYDWPIPDGDAHCAYITELLELQAEYKSKYVTVVEAPKMAGKHDDHADSLVRMIWSASQNLGKGSSIAGHRIIPGQQRPASPYALRRKSMQMGSHPDRQVPRLSTGGSRFVGRSGSSLESLIVPPWRKK